MRLVTRLCASSMRHRCETTIAGTGFTIVAWKGKLVSNRLGMKPVAYKFDSSVSLQGQHITRYLKGRERRWGYLL